MKVFLSDTARSDLLQLYGYLAERSPSAARAALETINVKFADLTRFPFIEERIVVVRVLDGRRDIDEEFKR